MLDSNFQGVVVIGRPGYLEQIRFQFEVHPIVAVLGARQCGKTTLAGMYADQYMSLSVTRFDLEDPTHLARLDSPKLALEGLQGLVIIDEVQRTPGLFEILRVLVDRRDNPARFLILGSASRDLLCQSSETLAGRIGYIELAPFSVHEVGAAQTDRLWLGGAIRPLFWHSRTVHLLPGARHT